MAIIFGDPDPPSIRDGRVIRSFNQDLESVLLAVLTFLSGGILMFVSCFLVTKILQCYKRSVRRKRRRARGEDDEGGSGEWPLDGVFDEESEEDESRLVA